MEYNTVPTMQQRAAIEKLVELRGTSVSRAMRESKLPYTFKTAKNPKNLTESKGFKQLLNEYGLTEGLITRALVADIKAKKNNRLGELNLGSEILGMKKRDDPGGGEKPVPILNVFVKGNLNITKDVRSNDGNAESSEPHE